MTVCECVGYAYYGEYPLSFAACFGYEDIYDYLINHGADPNRKDSFGNTVLHMMVISNRTVRDTVTNFHSKPWPPAAARTVSGLKSI